MVLKHITMKPYNILYSLFCQYILVFSCVCAVIVVKGFVSDHKRHGEYSHLTAMPAKQPCYQPIYTPIPTVSCKFAIAIIQNS